MLTSLDESFLHQAPVTFDQTDLSDHRFFDRIWLGGCNAQGLRVMMGMASYKNTNTFDGYFVVLKYGKQYNLRASRPFLPRPEDKSVGPITVEVVKPLHELRVIVAPNAGPLSADLVFTSTVPVREEAQHLRRVDGRLVLDYRRFDQIGRLNGWFNVAGERIAVTDWFGARDHSWGIRAGMGGYEPPTSTPRPDEHGSDISAGMQGFLVVWLAFEAGNFAGYLQQLEDGAGKISYTDGHILTRAGQSQSERKVTRIEHELTFVPGTRSGRGGSLRVTLDDGEVLQFELQTHLPPAVYKGGGYDSGFFDERGLGLHRGTIEEHDVYDVSHPENVVLEDGRVIRPWHREATCSLTVNGQSGLGHFPIISTGNIRRYGLTGAITNKKE